MKTYVITTAVIRNKDKFLIAKRSATKKFAPNRWEFISGFMDTPKSAEDVILKELKEELNVGGKIIDTSSPFDFSDDEGRWIVIPFLIEIENKEVQVNPSDHSEIRWVTVNELKEYSDIEPFLENEGIKKFLRIQK